MKTLLITVDSLRFDHFGMMENTIGFLEETYDKAFSVCSATMGSFQGSITGHYPSGRELPGPPFPADFDCLTVGITTNHFLSERYGYGNGFDVFEAPAKSEDGIKENVGRRLTPGSVPHIVATIGWNTYQSLRDRFTTVPRTFRPAPHVIDSFITHVDGEDEWFGWLHFMEPHHPYEPDTLDVSRVECQNATRRVLSGGGDEQDEELVRTAYEEEVRYLDEHLSRLWEWLEDDVRVVFCSDHGELLGEDGMWGHPGEMREELLHVPFGTRNVTIDNDLISLVDVPTLLSEDRVGDGDLDREVAYATYGDKKAVIDRTRIYDGENFVHYDEGVDRLDENLQNKWERFTPGQITKDYGQLEDLKDLGYV